MTVLPAGTGDPQSSLAQLIAIGSQSLAPGHEGRIAKSRPVRQMWRLVFTGGACPQALPALTVCGHAASLDHNSEQGGRA